MEHSDEIKATLKEKQVEYQQDINKMGGKLRKMYMGGKENGG